MDQHPQLPPAPGKARTVTIRHRHRHSALACRRFAAVLLSIVAGPICAQTALIPAAFENKSDPSTSPGQAGSGKKSSPSAISLTPGHLARQVIFDEQSPLATNATLHLRLPSPRQRMREVAMLAARNETLALFPLNLGTERFSVYLPRWHGPAGYGLLVFISPSREAPLPLGWAGVLDHAGYIFVSAERSGNEEDFASRRIPLALTAVHALTSRYPIDSERLIIGGFSGGSRVALRAAVAYPDVFSGAVLNAGSDPLGGEDIPLPSAALMSLLQTRSRFAFVTGDGDDLNLAKDGEARASLSRWCIAATTTIRRPATGHEIMDASSLSQALRALDRPNPPDPVHFNLCRARLDASVARARRDAAMLRAQPENARTGADLDRLDRAYGALLGDGPSY